MKIVCALIAVVITVGVASAGVVGPLQAHAAFQGTPGRIAFVRATSGGVGQIYTIAADGSGLRQVTHAPTDAVAPSWSADGRRLVLTMAGAVWQINGDGHRLMRITRKPIVDPESPTWSPSGKRIAFSARSQGSNFDVYTSSANGTAVRRLTRSRFADEHPSWSPNGRRIVFARAPLAAPSGSAIWVMNVDGTRPQRLAAGGSPDWSPDGRQILFTRGSDIWLMRADGTHAVRLTHEPGVAGDPAWSPDGRAIVFWSDRASGEATKGDLYVIAANGTPIRRLTSEPDYWHFAPAWQPLRVRR
jgi:Tol biopolymer transport system component